jgi:pimeloyl-ACP methyl ester carboxylesterase
MFATSLAAVLALAATAPAATPLPAGEYRSASGHVVYVGAEHTLPERRYDQYYDNTTRRIGDASSLRELRPQTIVKERRFVLFVNGAKLGASVWYNGEGINPTIVLIHGNDDETREMGFLIPYFVLHGMTVIAYDQRGTGESEGNWRSEGPPQRARDVIALVATVKHDAHVDPQRIGIWAFSNGGWTAPIVAVTVPLAFMVLKSAPAETQQNNILYEVAQRMAEHGFSSEDTSAALRVDRSVLGALEGVVSWDVARKEFAYAKQQKWFAQSALPDDFPMPPPPAMLAAFRRAAIYDPATTLRRVRTPTLALFGTLDRNVDVGYSAPAFKAYFKEAGMSDFSERLFVDAGHTLEVSATGYYNQPALPRRLVPYMSVTIAWLQARHFAR